MLNLISSPADYVVSVAEAKAHLVIETSTEDTRIAAMLDAAEGYLEAETGRAIYPQQWRYTIDDFPVDKLYLPKPPLQSIVEIQYYDTDNNLQTWDSSNYHVMASDTAQGWIEPVANTTYPGVYVRPDAVQIDFSCGYVNIPPQAEHAIKLLLSAWNEDRGDGDQKIPAGVKALINQISVGQYL